MNSKPNLKRLSIDKIVPNTFNPNRMPDEDFESYVAEVQRLGYPPKPIVVRPLGNAKYEIVDGEHGWRAAQANNMKSVTCEVRKLDDFTAKAECYKRNRGGTDNCVVLASMFISMMKDKGISQRALAKEVGVSEGTVRKTIDYSKAAELRRDYAPQTADGDIADLTQSQVRMYSELPESVRDRWLDAGADTSVFDNIHDEWPACRVPAEISRFNLAEYLDTASSMAFRDSVERLAGQCLWATNHKIKDVRKYLQPVARQELSANVLDLLPLEQKDGECRVVLTQKQWSKVLTDADKHVVNKAGLLAAVESGVRVALRDAGRDLTDVLGPEVAEALQIISEGPECVQTAQYLTLKEKLFLVEADAAGGDSTVSAAITATCDMLQSQRSAGDEQGGQASKTRAGTVPDVFHDCLSELQRQSDKSDSDDLFADEDRLFETVMELLGNTSAIAGTLIEDRPAIEVARERLGALEWPEFFMIASGLLHGADPEDAGNRWLEALAE